MKKHRGIIVLTLCMLLAAAWGIRTQAQKHLLSEAMELCVTLPGGTETVRLWQDTEAEATVYAFLPANAVLEETVVETGRRLYLDGQPIVNGQTLAGFRLDVPYSFSEKNGFQSREGTLIFKQSANVAAMFLTDFQNGTKIASSDSRKLLKTGIHLFDKNGNLNYRSGHTDSIRLRGNSTATLPKKPYAVMLEAEAGLLGMEPSSKWVLLANALDNSGIRNKIIFDFAVDYGFQWTSQSEFVDVYIDGSYQGLYQLTEKIEVSDRKVSLQDGFLFEMKPEEQMKSGDFYITLDSGRCAKILYPENMTYGMAEPLRQKLNALEKSIVTEDWTAFAAMIDTDSWAYRFLIDYFFVNVDSDWASSFYRYDTQQDLFYAGPIWDYDMALGNDEFWGGFRQLNPNQDTVYSAEWYPHLYRNEAFMNAVADTYEKGFRPLLAQWVDTKLPALLEEISTAMTCNSLRWQYGADVLERTNRELTAFLTVRTEFITNLWVKKVPYYTLRLHTGGEYNEWYSIMVQAGESVWAHLPQAQIAQLQTVEHWYDGSTGAETSIPETLQSDVILCDDRSDTMVIHPQNSGAAHSQAEEHQKKTLFYNSKLVLYIMYEALGKTGTLFFGMMGGILLSLLCADIIRWRKRRKGADTQR